MPKSRRRLRRFPPLISAKNLVRGASNKHAALIEAAHGMPADMVHRLVQWAETVPLGSGPGSLKAFPDTFKEVLDTAVVIPKHLEATAITLVQRFSFYPDPLREFSSRRDEYFKTVLAGDFEAGLALLEQIEARHGASIWLLDARLATIALARGLESQKKYRDEFNNSRYAPMLSAIAHYISQRNESSTSPTRFDSRIKALLAGADLEEPARDFYLWCLCRSVAAESAPHVLLYASLASLTDAYVYWEEFCMEHHEVVSRQVVDSFPAFDVALMKIRSVVGQEHFSSLPGRSLDIDDSVLCGGPGAPTALAEGDDPRVIWLLALATAAGASPPIEPDSPLGEMIAALSALLLDSEAASESATAIQRLALNLHGSTTVRAISALSFDLIGSRAPFDASWHRKAAFLSPYLDPWDLPFLSGDVQQRYAEALRQRYGSRPVVDYLMWLASLTEDPPANVSRHFRLIGEIHRMFAAGRFVEVLESCDTLALTPAFRGIAMRWKARSLQAAGREEQLIAYAARQLVDVPSCYPHLPVDEICSNKKWKDLREFAAEIGLAVLLDMFWRRDGGSEVAAFRRYAVEDYLRSIGARVPSEMPGKLGSSLSPIEIYFLSDVCTPPVLDMMFAFESTRDVQLERRDICAVLVDHDPSNADRYTEEITKITQSLMIEEGVRLLDQSRIFVDVDALSRWASREVNENYDRFKALQDAGVGSDAKAFAEAMREFLMKQEPLPEIFRNLPKGEADELLLATISQLHDSFLLSPAHGLDAYLSLRVRHGTLAGMLRGPVEEFAIICQRIGGTSRYERVLQWKDHLCLSDEEEALLHRAMTRFSEKYDGMIEMLRSRLQIKRPERADGLFELPLTAVHIHLLRGRIEATTSLDKFVRDCADLFWIVLEGSLKAVRQYIEGDVRVLVAGAFGELEAEVRRALGDRALPMIEAVSRARTAVQSVLANVVSWFERSAVSSNAEYSLRFAVDIAIEAVRTTYRRFSPAITKQIDVDEMLSVGTGTIMSDVIFTALDNVYKHSGVRGAPAVEIRAERVPEVGVRISVRSEVAIHSDRAAADEKLANIRSRIEKGEFKTSMTSGEGGTGLMKLKALVDPYGVRADALEFGFVGDGHFEMAVVIDMYEVGV